MQNKPLISIITVVFNSEKYIEETILSIINQTYQNIEYIIIDGGSTDSTIDIIKKYENKISYWISEKDGGVYDAMNKGIKVSNGEWINFINAGDRLLYLDLNSLLNNTTTNSSYYFDEEKSSLRRDPFTKSYLTHNTTCHQSIFYKKDEILSYNLNYPIIADFEQMTRVCKNSFIPSYSQHIVFFAKAGLSYESNKDKSIENLKKKIKIIKNNLGFLWGLVATLHSFRIFILK